MSSITESIQVENVVATADIGQELDLETLAEDLSAAKFNPDNFPGLVYRSQDPKAVTLTFRSGKVVCTGARTIDGATTALDEIFDTLHDLGVDVAASPDIEIQNIVSSGDLDRALNLNAIAIGLGLETVEYEPEQFPGLVYRLDDPDVVTLLFGSGKFVVTGGRHLDDAENALKRVKSRLTDIGLLN
jgi:transcription initiation factor TFIID TATA-box-binding protein